ncbi:MAG: nitrous oxide reductase family maturation protein NosD [Planctomycetaceae bacterium]
MKTHLPFAIAPFLFVLVPVAGAGGAHRIYYVDTCAKHKSDDGDGTSPKRPFKTIRRALAHLQAGDTVRVAPGTYHEGGLELKASGTKKAPIRIVARKVVLHGDRRDEVGLMLAKGVHDIEVEGLTIENMGDAGFHLGTDTSRNRFTSCTAAENGRAGFLVESSKDNVFTKCQAYGSGDTGFLLRAATGNVISSCRSHRNGANGFAVLDGSSKNTLSDCESWKNNMRGFLFSGKASGNHIRKNRSHHNSILGFGVYDGSRDNVFEANNVHRNFYHGFAILHNAHGNTFRKNKVHHQIGCGFYLEASTHNTFDANECHRNQLDGFALFYKSTGNKFTANFAHHNGGHALQTDSSTDAWVASNRATDNAEGAVDSRPAKELEDIENYTK